MIDAEPLMREVERRIVRVICVCLIACLVLSIGIGWFLSKAFGGELSPSITIEQFRAAIGEGSAGVVRSDGSGNQYQIRPVKSRLMKPNLFQVEVEVRPLPRGK